MIMPGTYLEKELFKCDKFWKFYCAEVGSGLEGVTKDLQRTLELRGIETFGGDNASSLVLGQAILKWTEKGKACTRYTVSPGLEPLLRATKMAGLKVSDFSLPYDSVVVRIGNATCRCIQDYFSILDGERGASTRTKTLFTSILLDGADAPMSLISSMRESSSLDEEIEAGLRLISRDKTHGDAFYGPFRILINAMLYATYPEADIEYVEMNPEARRLWKKAQKLPVGSERRQKSMALHSKRTQRTKMLGGRIDISRSTPKDTSSSSSAYPDTPQWQTYVSGHWKMQPCGKGRRDRHRIWIQPYVKGPEGAPFREAVHFLKA